MTEAERIVVERVMERQAEQVRRAAGEGLSLEQAWELIIVAGIMAVNPKVGQQEPDPVATQPVEPRYSHISGEGE